MSASNSTAGVAAPSRLLEGRVAIVTGSAWGMGRRHAERLAEAGARVVLVDINEEMAKETAAKIPDAIAVRCDVSSEAQTLAMAETVIKAFGRIDILVNNAGGALFPPGQKFWEIDEAHWDKVVNVNLKGTFLCARAVFPSMREAKWGRIINIVSTAGLRPSPTLIAYSSAKGGVVAATRTMAAELGPFGITVNAVAPGYVDVEHPKIAIPPEARERLTQKSLNTRPINRVGRMDDISNAVLFFASPASEWVTGQLMPVNGGDFCN